MVVVVVMGLGRRGDGEGRGREDEVMIESWQRVEEHRATTHSQQSSASTTPIELPPFACAL
jgi:hypothetical protein